MQFLDHFREFAFISGGFVSAKKCPRKGRVPGGQRTPSFSGSDWSLASERRRAAAGAAVASRFSSLSCRADRGRGLCWNNSPEKAPWLWCNRSVRLASLPPTALRWSAGTSCSSQGRPIHSWIRSCVPHAASGLDSSLLHASWREDMETAECGQERFFGRFSSVFPASGNRN